MSSEENKESTYNLEKRLSDDDVSLIDLADGNRAILLKIANEADVKDRCFWLERTKKSSLTRESRQLNYMSPSLYHILPEGNTIKITGDLDELEDAANVLHQCHNYISSHKMNQLTGEISDLRFKAQQQIWEKERHNRRAKKEERIREKYGPLIEKYGLDKSTAFDSLSNTKTKSSAVSAKIIKNTRP